MIHHIIGAHHQWYRIGTALGIPYTKLKQIEALWDGFTEQCLVEIIEYWLNSTPIASWEKVVNALEDCHLSQMALTIMQQCLLDQCECAIIIG